MTAESFPTDAGLPELEIASDHERMREIFQSLLRPLNGKEYRIADCRLSRVRYRRGNRCILQYTLRLVDPTTGQQRNQWVTGVIYAGNKAHRLWEKPRAEEIPAALQTFEPVSFISDLRMLVQVFPYDRRLPSLASLMAGPPSDLEPLLLPAQGHAETWDIKPIRYRAGLGAVLQYCARRADKRFYVKVYRDDQGERTFQALQALSGKKAESEAFAVARPIAYLSELRALVLEEAPGISLEQILLHGQDTVAAVRSVARALARFHQSDTPWLGRHARENEMASLVEAAMLLESVCPHWGAKLTGIIDAIAARLEETPLRPTHRDLKPDHLLLQGNRVGLVDLDSFAGADPVLDAADLLSRLAALPAELGMLRGRAQAAARAFADTYFAHVPNDWRRRLPAHYAGAHIHLAVGFFRSQTQGWRENIAGSIREAQNSLAGKVW